MDRRPQIIIRSHHDTSFDEVQVIIRNIAERPLQELTEAQLNVIPDRFRCFTCQREVKKRDIGGIELGQRLCKWCYPILDEWWVGVYIKFDLYHHFTVRQ